MKTLRTNQILGYTHTTFYVKLVAINLAIKVTKKDLKTGLKRCFKGVFNCDVKDFKNGNYEYHTIEVLL